MTRREMLQLALMSSENRAASCLARNYPGGTQAFVEAMNRKAASLGMLQTHFNDATGLSSENVATARDLARMVQAAAGYPLIREFTTTASHSVEIGPSGRVLGFNNTNSLVRGGQWDITLSKTGFIREAGKCLVMLANIVNRPVVIVLLDSYGKLSRIADAQRVKYWLETGESLALPTDSHIDGRDSGRFCFQRIASRARQHGQPANRTRCAWPPVFYRCVRPSGHSPDVSRLHPAHRVCDGACG